MSRVLGSDPPYLLAQPGGSVPFEGVLKFLGHWHLSVWMSWVMRPPRGTHVSLSNTTAESTELSC